MMKTWRVAIGAVVGFTLNTADMSGEWLVKGSFDAASVAKGTEERADLVCTFAERGASLSGACRPASGPEGAAVAGSVHDRDVEWHFDIALGRGRKKERVTYRGTLDDERTHIRGTFRIADLGGEFNAEKE